MQISDFDHFKLTPVDAAYPANFRTFYSPYDHVHEMLAYALKNVRQSLVISMFGYDDDELAELVDNHLKNPLIYVQITLDKSQAGGVHEKALLEKYKNEMEGNSVAIGTSEHGAIIHRKMVVIDGIWRITGSTNWSLSGEQQQDNEATVTYDATASAEARHMLDLSHTKALKDMLKRKI